MKLKLSLLMALVSVFFMMSCDMLSGDDTKFKTTESGLQYKLVVNNDDARVPQSGEIISLVMTYGIDDSVMFNTNQIPDKVMLLPMQESVYPGDFYEMMSMMHLGDSAVFFLDAEEFITKTAGGRAVPPELKDQQFTFNVKLDKIQTEQEMNDEQTAKMEKLQNEEADILKKYLEDNNIKAEPTESGLYVIVTEQGNGPKPKLGDKIKAHYTGKLLDGTVFDSSVEKGTPFEFPLGQGRVIRGWDEGFALMNVGSKATLIIPSHLGYGERGSGPKIPPFSPLLFDVELIDIVK